MALIPGKIVVATTTGFHLRHLARVLVETACDVTFISALPRYKVLSYGIPYTHQKSVFVGGLPFSAIAVARFVGGKWKRLAVERTLEATDNLIAERLPECDLFVGLSAMSIRSSQVAKRRYGAKVIIDRGARHVLSQAQLLGSDRANRLTNFYIDRELRSYAEADKIMVPSSHVLESFLENGFSLDRLILNPLGLDTTLFHDGERGAARRRKSVLYVGGWNYQKGCDVLSEAIELLPELNFTHIGAPGNVSFPAAKNFTTLGPKRQAEVARQMRQHECLVLPSRQDGFGMVLLEALGSGMKVVATHITAAPDLARDSDLRKSIAIIAPGSVEELCRTLGRLDHRATEAKDETLRSSFEEKYSWDAYARRFGEQVAEQFEDRSI